MIMLTASAFIYFFANSVSFCRSFFWLARMNMMTRQIIVLGTFARLWYLLVLLCFFRFAVWSLTASKSSDVKQRLIFGFYAIVFRHYDWYQAVKFLMSLKILLYHKLLRKCQKFAVQLWNETCDSAKIRQQFFIYHLETSRPIFEKSENLLLKSVKKLKVFESYRNLSLWVWCCKKQFWYVVMIKNTVAVSRLCKDPSN